MEPISSYCIFSIIQKLQPELSRLDIIDQINSAGVPCFVGSCSEVYLEKDFCNHWNAGLNIDYQLQRSLVRQH